MMKGHWQGGRIAIALAGLSLSMSAAAGSTADRVDPRLRRVCDRAADRALDPQKRFRLCAEACPVTYQQALRVVTAGTPTADEEATAQLLARIGADLSALPADASTEDLEAAIVYAISQSGAKPQVVRAVLDRLGACDYGRAHARDAFQRVRIAVLRDRTRGTAAIPGSGFGPSDFSTPTVNIGGGSSNYIL